MAAILSTYARHPKTSRHRAFCVCMKHKFVRVFVKLVDVGVLQPHSAQYCHRTFADLSFGMIYDHASVDTMCGRTMCAPVLRCKGLGVLARTSPGPMQATSCSRYALTHALPLTRPSTIHQRAGLHAQHARELPERGGRSPRLHAIVRGGTETTFTGRVHPPAPQEQPAQRPHPTAGRWHSELHTQPPARPPAARPPTLPTPAGRHPWMAGPHQEGPLGFLSVFPRSQILQYQTY
jgi:hypothetical protein